MFKPIRHPRPSGWEVGTDRGASCIARTAMRQRHRRRLALLIALALAPGARALAQSQEAALLSLDAVVALAREQNRALQIARAESARAREQWSAFRTHRRPLFDVKLAAGSLVAPLDFRFASGVFGALPPLGPIPREDTVISTGPRPAAILFATVTQPLTQLPRLAHGERAAQLAVEVSTEEARAREAEIVAAARKLYYGIVQAESGIRAREESVRHSREFVRVLDRQAAERVALEADALAAQAGLRDQEFQLARARNAAVSYREQLNALLARDLDQPFAVEPLRPADVADEDLAAAEAAALAGRPEIRVRRLESDRAEAAIKATKRPGVPDVSVSFNYAGFYNFELLPHHGALAGVIAAWEPWDWGRGRADLAEKEIRRKQAGVAVEEAVVQVRLQLRTAFRALREAFAQFEVSEAARDAARERLRVITARFAQDAALERDLLDAQTRLIVADQASAQALAGYWSARADYERARAVQ